MKYHVKAYYPKHSWKIACIQYTSDSQKEADSVRDKMRAHSVDTDGSVRGLYFTHDDNGKGTTSLETHWIACDACGKPFQDGHHKANTLIVYGYCPSCAGNYLAHWQDLEEERKGINNGPMV